MLKSTQTYSNPIPKDFGPMITYQTPIPWIINKWNCVLSSRVLRLLLKKVLFLDTISITCLILVLCLWDIFQHLKNHNHHGCLSHNKHKNQILALKCKNICITKYQNNQFIQSNLNKYVWLSMVENLGLTTLKNKEEIRTIDHN